MASSGVGVVPPNLKAVQHYIKTADEHDKRDKVISYYCRLYALQRAMEIDRKSPDCRTFLMSLMDVQEQMKASLADNEAIQSETVGQAHLENYALKLFLYADNKDRAGEFDKNVVKSFFTAGLLFDVLSVFGETDEEIEKNKKYAKWKAAYIHKCLKNGETPIAGPLPENEDDSMPSINIPPQSGFGEAMQPGFSGLQPSTSYNPNSMNFHPNGPTNQQPDRLQKPPTGSMAPPTTPQDSVHGNNSTTVPATAMYSPWKPPDNPAGVHLTTQDYQKAMKFCKFASSSLQYEDSKTAIENLQKALTLLTTGHEM